MSNKTMVGFFKKQYRCPLWLMGSICTGLLSTIHAAQAQIIPDTTLPNNTVVIPNNTTSILEGGTRVGSNLFHSFQEFSVLTGNVAFFNNAGDIQNIISRVTGGTLSNIDGLIGANGTANLFLINPNGIIFGANAQLSLGGSFIGSTATSIRFADGSEFSAINPQAPSLLTINVPIGLQFGSNPGSIINQSQATSPVSLPLPNSPIPIPSNVGLQVLPGRTLALIGGDLSLNNGNLTALSGEIQLGSVASPGRVSFIPTATGLALDYTGIQNFGTIELSGIASVNASGLGGGAIRVRGGNVILRDRSNLVSDTLGSLEGRGIDIQAAQFRIQDQAFVTAGTIGTGAGGNLTIRATDGMELRGTGFDDFQQRFVEATLNGTIDPLGREGGLFTVTLSSGNAGNIIIDTGQLTLLDGAVILSPTFGTGAGGSIAIRTTELIDVSGSGILTTAFNQGNAGALTIDTGKLTIRDEASVSTATFGMGNSGDINVRASDSVILSEFTEESSFGTNLSTSTVGGTGNAGNLEITTRSLRLEGGATVTSSSGAVPTNRLLLSRGRGGNITIDASDSITVTGTSDGNPPSRSQIVTATLGSANSGDLRINTRTLTIQDGGGVGASTVGSGRGGDVFINASELVDVSGKTRNGVSPSGIATRSGDPLLSSFFPGQFNPTGDAGNINVTTGRLIVRDEATVNVESTGVGDAGIIRVVADAIALDNRGSIDASTGSGAGGNINLQAQDILLRRRSRIATNAGNSTGGNIMIDIDTLVAVPVEDSDITANAQQGVGGRVSITAQGIFGTQFRERVTPESDITATSELGPQFSGIVEIDIRGIDPARGLVELPDAIIDPSDRIATGCPADEGNSFAVTGRGGLPEDPTATLRGRTLWQDVRNLSEFGGQSRMASTMGNEQLTNNNQPIIEAQGWAIDANGQVVLVADASQVTSHSAWQKPTQCYQSNSL